MRRLWSYIPYASRRAQMRLTSARVPVVAQTAEAATRHQGRYLWTDASLSAGRRSSKSRRISCDRRRSTSSIISCERRSRTVHGRSSSTPCSKAWPPCSSAATSPASTRRRENTRRTSPRLEKERARRFRTDARERRLVFSHPHAAVGLGSRSAPTGSTAPAASQRTAASLAAVPASEVLAMANARR